MARVTGIGGVFLRAKDPKALRQWYADHLGIHLESYGAAKLKWTDEVPAGTGSTSWSTFPENTSYFGDHTQQVMINYRVDDIEGILFNLRTAGATIDPKRTDEGFGKFAWATDPEGNRFELWQPEPKHGDSGK